MATRLPNPDSARIDARKLRDYALSPTHESGKHKAAFFAQMGYDQQHWERLSQDIMQQHVHQEADAGQPSPYGQKYVITANLRGPSGETRQVTTVWIVRSDSDLPELVTIEPASRRKA